jgi:hypothetical protein
MQEEVSFEVPESIHLLPTIFLPDFNESSISPILFWQKDVGQK